MMATPMTFLVVVACLGMGVMGVVLILWGAAKKFDANPHVCPACKGDHPPYAKFCAHCGRKLQ